jgi:hypothetical protein
MYTWVKLFLLGLWVAWTDSFESVEFNWNWLLRCSASSRFSGRTRETAPEPGEKDFETCMKIIRVSHSFLALSPWLVSIKKKAISIHYPLDDWSRIPPKVIFPYLSP